MATSANVAAWGQGQAPVTASAVFGPGHTRSRTDLRGADVTYINADGRVLNTAKYGGAGTGWAISTTEYDSFGNVIRELTAANRQAALEAPNDQDWKGIAATDSAARALMLSTVSVYTADGQDLTDTYGPYREVMLSNGNLGYAREHTRNTYDTGAELGHPAGPVLHLVTSTYTAASLSPDPVATNETDKRTTINEYALSASDNAGWTFSTPMKVITDPAGIASTQFTRLDPTTGLTIETRMPSEPGGGGAGTEQTIYYTGGANSADAACGNKPAWVNLTCVTRPAAQPGVSGLPGLVTTRITAYDYLNRPLTTQEQVVDASGTTRTRTTTAVFDNDGYSTRPVSEQLTGGIGTPVTAGSTGYDPATGLATSISDGTSTSTTTYDDFGRVTTYTDATQASGDARNLVTTTYDAAGRVASITDAKGTITNTYNENGDTRNNVTSLTVTGVTGKFSGRYDADGRLVQQTWPNGHTQDITYDEDGEELNRRQVLGSTWLEETVTPSVHGQWRRQTSTGEGVNREQTYTYDALGRLTWTRDNGSGQCLHRNYRFDANSNRTQRIVYGPTADGACQATTAQSTTTYSYDSADRLQATGSHAGLTYDAYGRITTLPAADTSSGTGNVTIGYYTNDLVRSLTQDGTTLTYNLDAPGRLKTWTNTTTGVTKTNHYGDTASDSPDWISETTDGTTWTRNITDLSGNLAATIDHTGKLVWQTVNQHGDVTATTANAGTSPDATYSTDEFGVPISTTQPNRYGWLGGKQRSSETLGGLTLMGVRLYSPQLGRFLQTDPVAGGSANAYDYANADPINTYDLDGRCPWCAAIAGAAGACIRFCRYGLRAAKWGGRHGWRAAKWGGRKAKKSWKRKSYYRSERFGARMFHNRMFGKRSWLFGNKSFGRSGWLNRKGSRVRVGWSTRRMEGLGSKRTRSARWAFRIGFVKRHRNLFRGPFLLGGL